jgi:hypothetical protein
VRVLENTGIERESGRDGSLNMCGGIDGEKDIFRDGCVGVRFGG